MLAEMREKNQIADQKVTNELVKTGLRKVYPDFAISSRIWLRGKQHSRKQSIWCDFEFELPESFLFLWRQKILTLQNHCCDL